MATLSSSPHQPSEDGKSVLVLVPAPKHHQPAYELVLRGGPRSDLLAIHERALAWPHFVRWWPYRFSVI